MDLIWVSIGIILAIWVQRKLYQPKYISSIEYQLRLSPHRVVEGDHLHVQETIRNKGFLPFSLITTTLKVPNEVHILDDQIHASHYHDHWRISKKTSLFWFQKAARRYELSTAKRGVYSVQLASLRYSDALRLDEHRLNVDGEGHVVVYPKVYDMDQIISDPLHLSGDHFVQRWILEDYFFPSGVRDYQFGDPLRFVDWKKTAKTQEMKTRIFDYTNSNQLHLILNLQTKRYDQGGQDPYPELVEDMIRVAATIVQAASREGFAIGLYANGGCVGYPGQSLAVSPHAYQGVDQLFEYLARLQSFHSQNFDVFFEKHLEMINNQADIMMITSYMNDQIYQSTRDMNDMARSMKLVAVGDIEERYQEGLPIYPAVIHKEGAQNG